MTEKEKAAYFKSRKQAFKATEKNIYEQQVIPVLQKYREDKAERKRKFKEKQELLTSTLYPPRERTTQEWVKKEGYDIQRGLRSWFTRYKANYEGKHFLDFKDANVTFVAQPTGNLEVHILIGDEGLF